MSYVLVCEGAVSVNSDGSPTCSTGWQVNAHVAQFDASQIDPAVATAMFGGGFALFIVPWAAAWGISQILRLLR